jgi:hypothetical protein
MLSFKERKVATPVPFKNGILRVSITNLAAQRTTDPTRPDQTKYSKEGADICATINVLRDAQRRSTCSTRSKAVIVARAGAPWGDGPFKRYFKYSIFPNVRGDQKGELGTPCPGLALLTMLLHVLLTAPYIREYFYNLIVAKPLKRTLHFSDFEL